jgi:hypothetical protein
MQNLIADVVSPKPAGIPDHSERLDRIQKYFAKSRGHLTSFWVGQFGNLVEEVH